MEMRLVVLQGLACSALLLPPSHGGKGASLQAVLPHKGAPVSAACERSVPAVPVWVGVCMLVLCGGVAGSASHLVRGKGLPAMLQHKGRGSGVRQARVRAGVSVCVLAKSDAAWP